MRGRRGLSFIELLMAMTVTFLAISFLMGVFVTGIRHAGRSRHTALATTLAQSRMERLGAMPADRIVPCTGEFPGTEFTYSIDLSNAGDYDGDGSTDPDMKLLTLVVNAPDGAHTTLTTLKPAPPPLFGAACPNAGDMIVFAEDMAPQPYPFCEDLSNNLNNGVFFLFNSGQCADPTLPASGRPGCTAVSADGKQIWAVDIVGQGIRCISPAVPTWSNLLKPTGIGRPTGLACNDAGNELWLADESNRCLWRYLDAPARAGTWTGPLAPPAGDALGRLKGVACNGAGSEIWVVDADNNCVRRFNVVGSSWDATRYGNTDIAEPMAVAVSGDGKKIFVMDLQYLHALDLTVSSTAWTREDLPAKLRADAPQGLACNAAGDALWATPRIGPPYTWDAVNGWVEMNSP